MKQNLTFQTRAACLEAVGFCSERLTFIFYVLFKTQAAALYQHIKIKATAESFKAAKARTACVSNDFKND